MNEILNGGSSASGGQSSRWGSRQGKAAGGRLSRLTADRPGSITVLLGSMLWNKLVVQERRDSVASEETFFKGLQPVAKKRKTLLILLKNCVSNKLNNCSCHHLNDKKIINTVDYSSMY